jgi:SAM-dependent methyltransferase
MDINLQHKPKSVILEKGYINVYSVLHPKERRQLGYKRRYKKEMPAWDETLVYLASKFSSIAPENSIVLDAGCGNGNYLIDENRSKIARAVGVDVDAAFTQKNICLDEIKISDLEKLPFESETFDVTVSLWVIEHLKNPRQVFSEIYRVLKPGGIFMFATPNSNYLPLKLVRVINSVRFNRLTNKLLFGKEENDVFPTYYKANSLGCLKKLTEGLFNIQELRLNSDVSYTSFNELTYQFTRALLKLPNGLNKFLYPHIIGMFKK